MTSNINIKTFSTVYLNSHDIIIFSTFSHILFPHHKLLSSQLLTTNNIPNMTLHISTSEQMDIFSWGKEDKKMEYKNSVVSSFIKALYTELLALEYTAIEHMKKRKTQLE
jgi:hypothetical protein